MLKIFDDPALLEVLADLEHERWSSWERYRNRPEKTDVDERRWATQRETSYSDLEAKHKESDRVEARKTLSAIQEYLNKKDDTWYDVEDI